MDRELWYKMLDNKEYKIARSAWGFFLKAHGDECDMGAVIDTIADGVIEILEDKCLKPSIDLSKLYKPHPY